MATATVEMVVCINVEVEVSDDTTYKQFYDKAAEAAKSKVKAYSISGMDLRAINEIKSVVAAKTTPIAERIAARSIQHEVRDNTQ